MTAEAPDTLLGLEDVTPGTQQWRLARMHLANWGGFHGGPHVVDVRGRSTLIGGGTGSGKSSLLDAWTSVLQPPATTALNAASNDVTGVRAPGARTALTYLRGKTGERSDDGGSGADIVLREGPVWGAIALEFASTAGGSFTIGRLMFAAEDATGPADMTNRWFATRGHCDLRLFERYATPTNTFHARRMREAMPGLEVFHTYKQAVEESFMPTLGIGRGGDGRKALDLLHDIQRAAPVTSVHSLFRDRVLERPSTFDRFDAGLHEFDVLTATHAEFTDIVEQLTLLRPIEERKAALEVAEARAAQVEEFGDLEEGGSTFAYWKATTWVAILDAADDEATAERDRLRAAEAAATRRAADLAAQADDLRERWTSEGGGDLARLRREADALTEELTRIRRRRDRAAQVTGLGDALPATREAWDEACVAARAFRRDAAGRAADLKAAHDAALVASAEADKAVERLAREITETEQRAGNVDAALDALRVRLAEAAGMTRADLPFVAELLDLAPGEEEWRVAADAALGGFAKTLLVPRERRAEFNRAVDGVSARHRVRFVSADPDLPVTDRVHAPNALSGKLVVKPGDPYEQWLARRIDEVYDHECVDDAADLVDDGHPRITRAGQERRGDRGAIGGGHVPVVGFRNEARVAYLRGEHATARAEADRLRAAYEDARDAQDAFVTESRRHAGLLDQSWDDLDEAGARAALADLTARITDVETGSAGLADLDARRRDLQAAADATQKELGRLESDLDAVLATLEEIGAGKDRWLAVTEDLERAGVDITAEQRRHLDALLVEDDPDNLDRARFTAAADRIRRSLDDTRLRAAAEADRARADLTRIFEAYLARWDDTGLSADADAYPDFLRILRRLDAHGVEDRRRAWADRIREWIGEHVYAMVREFHVASDDITQRLGPIQDVLDTLPFSARGNRLTIRAEYRPAPDVVAFQRRLRALAADLAGTDADLDDDAAVARAERLFTAARDLLDQVRERTAAGQENRLRAHLLDVRGHHRFFADEVDATGAVVFRYDNLAGKSGGETQELVAFITGAALRYQLGDDNRARPVFAPVVLDEAFIKADSMTSNRGAVAWPKLGFQPIVVAPEGSFTALEPHFDQLVAVTKNPAGHSGVHMLDDTERATLAPTT